MILSACVPTEQTIPHEISSVPQTQVLVEGLLHPLGLAQLPDGGLVIAEAGTGQDDNSAGVSLVTAKGQVGRLISGFSSSRDAGDLAGLNFVALDEINKRLYLGHFNDEQLWTLPLNTIETIQLPAKPFTPSQLTPAMRRLNNVYLVNPFDLTFDATGHPVVTDASGNGVAKATPNGDTRFIHRFAPLPNPATPADTIEAVPTGIIRVANEYYITLTGGCPYPVESGQLVAIDENRNQRTIVGGLNMPIDVAQGPDGTIWVLEFARFASGASCFDGSGYQPHTGRLSRLLSSGRLEPILTKLNFPAAVLPLADGSLYVSEVFDGQVLHITFTETQRIGWLYDKLANKEQAASSPTPQPRAIIDLQFSDVAAEVGLDFQHGAFQTNIFADPAAMMGGGLCWIDYDNDGWLDLYLVNSHAEAEIQDWQARGGLPRNALYRNKGGRFYDVSASTGADLALRGNGCVAADFNRDGWWDLYITADGANELLWNNGNGTFTPGGVAAGVAATEWNSAAVVGDLNQDGWPDLFVAAYIDLDRKISKPSGAFPQDYLGLPDRLYLHNGPVPDNVWPTFREITLEVGLEREERGLGALLSDLDQDGDLDLYLANDGHPNRLYANEPWPGGISADPTGVGFRFIDLVDSANAGDSGSGMGVAGGDYDDDGYFDLFVTNWQNEVNALYRNNLLEAGHLTFVYSTYRIGISGLGNNMTGWGVTWADFDHDTDQDLLVVNGRVPITDLIADRQLVRFYRNRSYTLASADTWPGQFLEWTTQVGLKDLGPLMARGSAVADYDNDGDLDLAINTIAHSVVLLRNEGLNANWLQVALADFHPGTKVIAILPDGRTLVRELHVGSSYLASEDPRLHFGLGTANHVAQLRIMRPNQAVIALEHVRANQVVRP